MIASDSSSKMIADQDVCSSSLEHHLNPAAYDSGSDSSDCNDDDDDLDGSNPTKRSRRTDDERLKRCRERNRVHARNTRERKKVQMDTLQYRIQELIDEKMRLKSAMAETTVGSILMSLAGEVPLNEAAVASISNPRGCSPSSSVVMFETSGDVGLALEKLKTLVSSELSDDEEMLEVDRELLARDKATCTSSDLDKIRRERNRMHAKKTRLRKKKIMRELELVISTLENDVKDLKQACITTIAKASGRSIEHASWLFYRAVNAKQDRFNSHLSPVLMDPHQVLAYHTGAPVHFSNAPHHPPYPLAAPKKMRKTKARASSDSKRQCPENSPTMGPDGPETDRSDRSGGGISEGGFGSHMENGSSFPAEHGTDDALFSLLSLGRSIASQYQQPDSDYYRPNAPYNTSSMPTDAMATSIHEQNSEDGTTDPSNDTTTTISATRSDGCSPKHNKGQSSQEVQMVRSQFNPPDGLSPLTSESAAVSSEAAATTSFSTSTSDYSTQNHVRLSVESLAAHTQAMERVHAHAHENAEPTQQQSQSQSSQGSSTGLMMDEDKKMTLNNSSNNGNNKRPASNNTSSPKVSGRLSPVKAIRAERPDLPFNGHWTSVSFPHPMHPYHLSMSMPPNMNLNMGMNMNMGMGMMAPPPQMLGPRAFMAEYCNMMLPPPPPIRTAVGLSSPLSSPVVNNNLACYPPVYDPSNPKAYDLAFSKQYQAGLQGFSWANYPLQAGNNNRSGGPQSQSQSHSPSQSQTQSQSQQAANSAIQAEGCSRESLNSL